MTAGDACTVAVVVTAGVTAGAIGTAGGDYRHRPMSALGHKRTFAPQKVMSALPPKADMCSAKGHVRFGPIADISVKARPQKLLASLV